MEQSKAVKMNWFDYWIGHCWMTGWQSIGGAFRIWGDLMGSNYKDYTLLHTDDPEEECLEWFWVSLGEDNVYPREFLEYLYELSRRVQSGEEKTYPMDLDKFDELIKVSEEDYDKLMEMMENPPPPSPALIELLNRKTPFEND